MTAFNLEQALAGAPVRLRDGSKAFVLKKLNIKNPTDRDCPLLGYFIREENFEHSVRWRHDGRFLDVNVEHPGDIIGMWQEPRQQVNISIPAPLKEAPAFYSTYWTVEFGCDEPVISAYWDNDDEYNHLRLKNGLVFATQEDAEAFIQAMRSARA